MNNFSRPFIRLEYPGSRLFGRIGNAESLDDFRNEGLPTQTAQSVHQVALVPAVLSPWDGGVSFGPPHLLTAGCGVLFDAKW